MAPKIPTIFISYAWEDDIKEWVREFSTRLREEGGVDVHIDQWHLAPGDPLPAFMESAVRTNDFVLLVCTPKYKAKSDDRQGGVGYEGDIITGEVFTKANHRKFIPILRKGDWAAAAPTFLLSKIYLDFRGDPYSEAEYKQLLKTLHGRLEQPPTIGPTPAFTAENRSAIAAMPIAKGAPFHSPAVDVGSGRATKTNSRMSRTIAIALGIGLLAVIAALVGLSRLFMTAPSTHAETLGQPERGWLEAYGAAIDSGDIDRIIALHALPTAHFFEARNQDAAQLRTSYQGWFGSETGRARRTGFEKCSLVSLRPDGTRALRCETYVDPPFLRDPSHVPTCLVFRSDGKLLSRLPIAKGKDCPPN